MQTWLSYQDWDIFECVQAAAKSGCKVEILLLDPYSPQVSARREGLRRPANLTSDAVRSRIINDLNDLMEIRRELEEDPKSDERNLEVRFYDAAPVFHLYDFGDSKFVGLFWRDVFSVRGPQLEIVHSNQSSTE